LTLNDHNFDIPANSPKERGKETWKQAYVVWHGQLTGDTSIFGINVTCACVIWLLSLYKLSFFKWTAINILFLLCCYDQSFGVSIQEMKFLSEI
jgi:hypothetical protein